MGRPTLSPLVSGQVSASNATDEVTVLTTPWMLAAGASTASVIDALRAEQGVLATQVQHRYASVLADRPDSWSLDGSARTSNGSGVQSVTLSSTDKLLIQFGLAAQVASGSGAAQGWASVQASLDTHNDVLARRTIDFQAVTNSSEYQYIALGEPVPYVGLDSLMWAIALYGAVGSPTDTPTYQPCFRTFSSDLREPSDWSETFDNSGGPEQTFGGGTDVELYNSDSIVPTVSGTPMFIQPGLKLGGTGARGTFEVVVVAAW